MKKFSISKIALMAFSLALLNSCNDDDDYVYPDLYNEFAVLTTDSEGTANLMTDDKGQSWNLPPINGLSGLVADTTYRVVVKFVPGTPENNNTATLYSSQGIIAPIPTVALNLSGIKTDPVKIQSIWRGGDYVNIALNVLVKDKVHKYSFIQSSLLPIDNGTRKKLSIILYHDNNNDIKAFYRTVYLSVPLWAYKDVLKKGDEIEIYINTYDDGVVKTLLYY